MKFNILTKKFFTLVFIGALAFSAPACSNVENSLRIGCFPNITHAQALYGMSTGSFERVVGELVATKWYTFNAGPTEMESIRTGNIDIGYVGPIPAITGYAASRGEITIIAGVSGAGSLLITAKDSNVSDVSQLSGRKVAVPQFGNTQDIILRTVLDEAGLSTMENGGTVEVVQQANASIKTLLEGGHIDAALVPEPWGSRLIQEAGANVLLDFDDIMGGDYPVAVIVVRNEYLENNREVVKAFLKEHICLTQMLQESDSEALAVVNAQINSMTGVSLSQEAIESAFGRIIFDYNISAGAMNRFSEMCVRQELIQSYIDFSDIADMSILQEAAEELRVENKLS